MSDPDRTPAHPAQQQTPEARERAPTLPSDHPDLRDQSGDEIRASARSRPRGHDLEVSLPRASP